ncbi:MAG: hypothetical protein QGH38_00430 [Candidatus Thalassarchaeaceae archaeon]|nr:hypothetical protein [Candidatus Thalassarchaeaceae archaeon]
MQRDRFMVAVGYHGHAFHGSQIQPDVRTVEGSISNALQRLTWWTEGCLEMSSRTDAGVSVRFNLARIDLPRTVSKQANESSIIRALNDHLPVGAVVLSASKVPDESKVRYADSRKYLYRLECIEEWPSLPDPDLLSSACQMIEGKHDFSNLSKIEDDRDPIRTVDECRPWVSGDGRPVGFVICAKSFLWNQVRRIASAFSGISSGRLELMDLDLAMRKPEIPVDMGRAPSEGLVLWEISHLDIANPLPNGIPEPSNLSTRPEDPREYRRWLSMSGYEISTLLENEWRSRLN